MQKAFKKNTQCIILLKGAQISNCLPKAKGKTTCERVLRSKERERETVGSAA